MHPALNFFALFICDIVGVLRVACLFSLRFLCLLFEFVTSFVSVWFRGVDFVVCVLVGKV